tara:strand:- start:37864 stop:38811 length:948 start_codon:yes stop_codon:yes gene_type:complete
MNSIKKNALIILLMFLLGLNSACTKREGINNVELPENEQPEPGLDVITLPVVLHVIHNGEPIGEGTNLSEQRIKRQIEILNEDFRRKENTRGFNDHPDGADTKIEFVLAKLNPVKELTNGINRINVNQDSIKNLGYNQNHYAQYSFWDTTYFINIWVTPLPIEAECIVLGISSGPETDLPGTKYLGIPGPNDAEGILINWAHFGESEITCHARYGRTLTHEMGHYLGLLHTWGDKECKTNDFVEDTPAVIRPVFGKNSFLGCDGEMVQVQNYMNYTEDIVMNMFTRGQAERMHYVLKNHSGRNSLISSYALGEPQ